MNRPFRFDEEMSNLYQEHVRQSVPCYDEIHKLVSRLLEYYIYDDTTWVDIGSGQGNLQRLVNNSIKRPNGYNMVCYETSPDMAAKIGTLISEGKDSGNNIICESKDLSEDIRCVDEIFQTHDINVITSVLSMQFISPDVRYKIIESISENIPRGGALILIEKVLPKDSFISQVYADLYYEYKSDMGITDVQIIDKMRSLRSVLKPFSMDEIKNYSLMFRETECFFTYLNFKGYIFQK